MNKLIDFLIESIKRNKVLKSGCSHMDNQWHYYTGRITSDVFILRRINNGKTTKG